MSERQQLVKLLFSSAIEMNSAAEQSAYLDEQCGQDERLRAEVMELIAHDRQASGFLEPSSDPPVATLEIPSNETPGHEMLAQMIGGYKIREKLGEGGMGVVYVAEQARPVRRKVALKIIKPGMDSKEVLGRFEAERQALAMMDHPNISRVIDGGATDTGQPFFVMELVRGPPVTEYCDKNRLANRERLRLFLDVCRAIQHAHQKGIIHRDIKPSNVLVPQIDGEPVPKVIDFGVAKAVSQKLTEQTVYTKFSQLVGTPLYMSPEQAEMGVVDIDTRSDVYSLGVLLYELLTGKTPFDRETLKQAGFDELRHIIREEEPPRPSAAVSTLEAQALSTVAKHRRTDARKLRDGLTGELDWIVMQSLEKDRTQRYESVSALAADVRRYLDDEPVQACPPSAMYRLRKFGRRHRVGLAIGAALSVALVLGVVGLGGAALLIAQQRDAAQTERAEAEMQRDRADRLRVEAERQQQAAEKQKQMAEENFRRAREAVDTYLTKVSEDQLLNAPDCNHYVKTC